MRTHVDHREMPRGRGMLGSWPLLVAGYGILLTLMIGSAFATWSKAERLYGNLSILNQEYRLDWRSLDDVRSGIHVSSVLVRDYLLDPSQSRAQEIRDELLKLRGESEPHLDRMEKTAVAQNAAAIRQLRAEIQSYWDTLHPVFEWTPQEKQAAAYGFLRQRIMPRREAVLSLADEVQAVMDSGFCVRAGETSGPAERAGVPNLSAPHSGGDGRVGYRCGRNQHPQGPPPGAAIARTTSAHRARGG
jgi:hypothetical protein